MWQMSLFIRHNCGEPNTKILLDIADLVYIGILFLEPTQKYLANLIKNLCTN